MSSYERASNANKRDSDVTVPEANARDELLHLQRKMSQEYAWILMLSACACMRNPGRKSSHVGDTMDQAEIK